MSSASSDGLQFDRAEYDGETKDDARKCSNCDQALQAEYFTANGNVICSTCRRQLAELGTGGSPFSRFARAVAFGLIGGAVGAGIYFAILKLTGYEVGAIAVVVGFLVGGGVRMGSFGRGGWAYQSLALAVTYAAIVCTYVPFILDGLNQVELAPATEATVLVAVASDGSVVLDGAPVTTEEAVVAIEEIDDDGAIWYYRQNWETEEAGATADAIYQAALTTGVPWYSFKDAGFTQPLSFSEQVSRGAMGTMIAWGIAFGIALFAPFFDVAGNLIGLLIIGFALFQAWKMNRRLKLEFEGPFELAAPDSDEMPAVREA